ncbi:MAG: GGDEF domain-containing protein [Bacilli bacterium]|jgi:diguanylate cyclase (GGDEF)-like protein
MKKKRILPILIYFLIAALLILIVVNYEEFIAYLTIITDKTIYLWFNLLILFIALLITYNFINQIKQAERKASDKHRQSRTDSMTGVYNRIGLEEYGEEKWEMAKNENTSFAVIFIDIDKFKTFNDTYGHNVGDVIITKIAEALKKSVRLETDLVARYGGDEFVILLSNIDKNAIHVINKRIQKNVKEIKVDEINESLTLSMGIIYTDKIDDDNSLDNIIHLSDVALYKAKEKGGNQYYFNDDH